MRSMTKHLLSCALGCLGAFLSTAALAVETFPGTNCESYNSPDTPYYNQVVHDGGRLHNFGYNQDLWTLVGCPVRWSDQARSLKVRITDSRGGLWCRAQARDADPAAGYTLSTAVTRYSNGSGAQILDFGNRPGGEFDLAHVWVECYLPPSGSVDTIILDAPAKTLTGGLTLR